MRFLYMVMKDFRVSFVFGEQLVILFDLFGMQYPLGFDNVQEYLLDLQIVLLNRVGSTKDLFM